MGVQRHQKDEGKAVWFDWDKTERRVELLLLLHPRPRVRPRLHQDLHLLPVSGQGVAERARVGQAPGPPSPRPLHRAGQRLRLLRASRASPGHLRPFRPGRRPGLLRPLDQPGPRPLHSSDRAAGYWWELSMRQVEVSRTLVFDDPRRARGFFESLVSDNIGIGRPDKVAMVFARQVRKTTKEPFRGRVFSPGTEVKMDFAYKHSRVKQYLKEGRALRIETVINKPWDLTVRSRLEHLPELVAKARQVNDRLLMIERAGQGCAIGSALFERIHQPYAREGQRTGAFRFGDARAMALAGALCCVVHAVTGFTNQSLRGLVAGLLGTDYSTHQMTYDLRRLRLHGLIERIPHTNTYVLTPEGQRVAASTPSSTGDCSDRSSRPTNHQHHSNSGAPSPSSTKPSLNTS